MELPHEGLTGIPPSRGSGLEARRRSRSASVCRRISPLSWDGNGRWASRRRLPRVAGHKAGVGPVRNTVESCARLGIKVLTLYAFRWRTGSARARKWRRSGGCCAFTCERSWPELQKNDIRLQAIGRLEALPADVRRELDEVVDATASNRGLLVNLAINYGGRTEIVDAVNAALGTREGGGTGRLAAFRRGDHRGAPIYGLVSGA